MDGRGCCAEDVRILTRSDGFLDIAGVETIFDIVVMRSRDFAVDKVRFDVVDEGQLEHLLHVARASRRCDNRMGGMIVTRHARYISSSGPVDRYTTLFRITGTALCHRVHTGRPKSLLIVTYIRKEEEDEEEKCKT